MVFARVRRLLDAVDTILATVRRIESRQTAMATQDTHIMRTINDALAAVRAETVITKAAATALVAIQAQLTSAQTQITSLQSAVAAGTADPVKVQELLDLIATSSAELSAAIPANTTASVGDLAGTSLDPATPNAVVLGAAVQPVIGTAPLGTAPVATDAPGTVVAPTAAESTSAGALSGASVVAPVVAPTDPI